VRLLNGASFFGVLKMPEKRCKVNGKSGVKFGNSGKCYTGPNKNAKMNKQRKAIKANQSKRK
jgi:hypothetical protein